MKFHGNAAENASENLLATRLKDRGGYGGSVETATCCHMSELDVSVYTKITGEWIWFSSIIDEQCPHDFLFHNASHYQILTSFVVKSTP